MQSPTLLNQRSRGALLAISGHPKRRCFNGHPLYLDPRERVCTVAVTFVKCGVEWYKHVGTQLRANVPVHVCADRTSMHVEKKTTQICQQLQRCLSVRNSKNRHANINNNCMHVPGKPLRSDFLALPVSSS